MSVMKDKTTGKWMYYGAYPKGHQKYGKQYKKRGFKTRREAMIAEDEFLDQSTNIKNYITVEQLADEFIKFMYRKVKASSINDYEYIIKKLLLKFKDYKLNDLDKEVLQDYFNELDSGYSKKYVEKIYYLFSKMLNYAIKKEYIEKNNLKLIDLDARRNEEKKEMLFWEPLDFEKFIAYVENPRYKACISFLYYMGCRRGEMIALRWNDIDLEKKTVKIDKTYSVRIQKITTPKTTNSYRTITMPEALKDILTEWKDRVKLFQSYDGDGFVFGNGNIPLKPTTLDRNFKLYIKEANEKCNNEIPVIRIHDLRHSHASYLINNMSAGFTDFDIAKRLGDTVQTLHSTYAHWFKSGDEGIIDFMNKDI